MEFDIKNCALIIMKSGERERAEERKLSSQKNLKIFGKMKNYKYLGILETKSIKHVEMKKKSLLEIKICSKNLIKGLNTRGSSFVRYSG